jgi:membrane protease YdiL (CAAX protease family)
MEDPRSGLVLVIIVLSSILRLNSGILIWTRRNKIPIIPSILLGILSPILCLTTVSYTTSNGKKKDDASAFRGSVVLMIALLFSQMITGMIFVAFYFLIGSTIPNGRALGPANDSYSFHAGHLLILIALSSFLLFIMLLILRPKMDPRLFFKGKDLMITSVLSILVLPVIVAIASGLSYILGNGRGADTGTFIGVIESPPDMIMMGIAIVILAPMIEELFFRGYLYDQIEKGPWPLIAIPLTSVLFSLVHFQPLSFLPIFFMGLIMGWTRKRTGSILPSLILHSGNNLIALFLLM